MKFNFKKISAVATSILMTGLTIGAASAASFPAPFVDNGKADVAVVYGANANLDMAAAGKVQTALGSFVKGETTTVEGGEAFALDKSSEHFNFNDALNSVHSTLDKEDMDFLADGTYDDGSIDEDYEQEITLSNKQLTLFADNDYNDDEPTVGFKWTNGQNILSYTMTFDDTIVFADMEDTDLPLLGGEYYVLDASTAGTLELLDSAEKTVLAEGETVTVAGKTVSIEFIDSDEVKFSVDGEITDKLKDHNYYELEDGSYIVANEVLYSDKETAVSKVEFSIGAGKMVLVDGEEIEVNEEDIDGLVASFDDGTNLGSITISWASDDETYLTESDSISMPVFEAVQLIYGGLDYSSESEMISLDNGETLTLNMGNYDLPLMWWDKTGTTTYLGEEDYLLVAETAPRATAYVGDGANTTALTGGLELSEDNRFIVTRIDDDLSDVETLYYEVTTVDNDSNGDLKIELKDLIGSDDLTFDSVGATDEHGDVTVTLLGADASTAYLTFAAGSDTITYNKAVSELGMVVTFPADVSSIDDAASGDIIFTEANEDGDVALGDSFNATVIVTSNDKLHASGTTVDTKEVADDKFVGVVPSMLASKITADQTGDEYDFEVEYFGKEVTADVQVVTGGATVSSTTSALGDILVKDSEIENVKSKNLVIVGGSCINSAAATVLGGAYCGEAFTEATGVAAGEFLIKGVQDAFTAGKLALVVAGYEAADTANAATYLTMKDVDTSEAYKGTSATEADLIVA